MESSQSKSAQSLMDAVSSTKEGRQYMVKRSKRKEASKDFDIDYTEVGNLNAKCQFCGVNFAVDGNINGSKNVKNHCEKCIGNPLNKGKGNHTELNFQMGEEDMDSEDGEMEGVNLKDVRDAVIYMIIVDGLPFAFVEKAGFRHLMGVACPRFNMPSRATIARDCLQLYHNEKTKLKVTLQNCQSICVTTDTWTSIRSVNYMCFTAHFIDSDWKLHKKILNFCPISSHKSEAIGKAVETCLEAWGIDDKLFCVTIDNASSNDVACARLRKLIQRTGCVSHGKYLHVRCLAHIINLIIWDASKEYDVSIDRIRNAVKYVINSPTVEHKFKELVQKFNIDSKSPLSLDVPTRWNTIFTMLNTALKFQRVFNSISLPNGEGLKESEKPPEVDDWRNVERLVVFLKGFYSLTRRISGSLYVTSNEGVFTIATVYNKLSKWVESSDNIVRVMAISMKEDI